jgi:hypothetical protein
VEWVWLNGQVMFPRSMLALPHAWRDWLLAHGVTCASGSHLGSAHCPTRPQCTYQRVGKQEHTPPQLPSIKELTDNLE